MRDETGAASGVDYRQMMPRRCTFFALRAPRPSARKGVPGCARQRVINRLCRKVLWGRDAQWWGRHFYPPQAGLPAVFERAAQWWGRHFYPPQAGLPAVFGRAVQWRGRHFYPPQAGLPAVFERAAQWWGRHSCLPCSADRNVRPTVSHIFRRSLIDSHPPHPVKPREETGEFPPNALVYETGGPWSAASSWNRPLTGPHLI
jgi:hypothetical protein